MKRKLLKEENIVIDVNTERKNLDLGKMSTEYSGYTSAPLALGPNNRPVGQIITNSTNGGRIYTYGLNFVGGTSKKQLWVVYDGRILTKNGGKFEYLLDASGTPVMAIGWPREYMFDYYQPVLKELGVQFSQDVKNKLKQNKITFQNLINQGANGNFFNDFNSVLEFFFPDDNSMRLTRNNPDDKVSPTEFYDITDTKDLEYNYKQVDVSRYQIYTKSIIYIPKDATGDLLKAKIKRANPQDCSDYLKDYIQMGFAGRESVMGNELRDKKKFIATCYSERMYQAPTFTGITRGDVDLMVGKDPFAGKKRSKLAKLFGAKDRPDRVLDINNIIKILEDEPMYNLEFLKNKNESKMKLDNIIREQLLEASNSKKRLIQESKIINLRFKMIVESANPKKSNNDMYVNLLAEMIYLHKQGFDDKLIAESAEGVFGVLSNLFGKSSGSIIDTFKEKGVEWIMGKIGLGKNSFLKNYLITTLGNTNLVDVPKLFTDCSFLTKKMAESIPEAYLRKLEYEKGMGNAFVDVIRNSLYDVVRNSDLAQKLETNLSTVICPLVDKMSSKFSDKLENMKTSLV